MAPITYTNSCGFVRLSPEKFLYNNMKTILLAFWPIHLFVINCQNDDSIFLISSMITFFKMYVGNFVLSWNTKHSFVVLQNIMHTVEWLTKQQAWNYTKIKNIIQVFWQICVPCYNTTSFCNKKTNPAASKKYDYYYVKVRGKVVILSVRTDVNFIWNKKPKNLGLPRLSGL